MKYRRYSIVVVGIGLLAILFLSLHTKTQHVVTPASEAVTVIVPNSAISDTTEIAPETDAVLQPKIDQLFIMGFRGTTLASAPALSKMIETTNLGGIILFDYDSPTKTYNRNVASLAQVKTLISETQEAHEFMPLFVAIDEEGGAVSRLKRVSGFSKTPSAAVLGTKSDTVVEETAAGLGKVLHGLGFNLDFAPVLDTNVNPSSPAIGAVGRSFSADPEVVAEKGIAFMKGLQSSGMIAVGKHFSGHGSATADSHLGFVDVTDTYKSYERIPFARACASGIDAIMVAHVFNRAIDATYPATLSKPTIDLLKNDTGCKNQLIISDDMDMQAITKTYGRKEALIRALNAGIDVLIISNNITAYNPDAFFEARKIVFDAVHDGSIPQSRIDDAYAKVTALKTHEGIIK